jgi:hypothetical protein
MLAHILQRTQTLLSSIKDGNLNEVKRITE